MNQIFILCLIFYSQITLAKDELNFNIGESISMHPFASLNETAQNFSNKLSKDGTYVMNKPTININAISFRQGKYAKLSLLYSRDCVDSPVYGFGYSFGNYNTTSFYYGFVFGGYFMNEKLWNERGITKTWISIGNQNAIVPLIGGEIYIKLFKIGRINANWHTYLNPVLINSTVSLGVSF